MGASLVRRVDVDAIGAARCDARLSRKRLDRLRKLYTLATMADQPSVGPRAAAAAGQRASQKSLAAWEEALRESGCTGAFEMSGDNVALAQKVCALISVQGYGVLGFQLSATSRSEVRCAPLPDRDCVVASPVPVHIVKSNQPQLAKHGAAPLLEWYGLIGTRTFPRTVRDKLRSGGAVLHRYEQGWLMHVGDVSLASCGEDDVDAAADMLAAVYYNCLRELARHISEPEPLPSQPPSRPGSRPSSAGIEKGTADAQRASKPNVLPPLGPGMRLTSIRASAVQRPSASHRRSSTPWIGRPGSAGSRDGASRQVLFRLPTICRHSCHPRLRPLMPAITAAALRRACVRLADTVADLAKVILDRVCGIELCVWRQRDHSEYKARWPGPPAEFWAGLRGFARQLRDYQQAGTGWCTFPPTPRSICASVSVFAFGPLKQTFLVALGPYVDGADYVADDLQRASLASSTTPTSPTGDPLEPKPVCPLWHAKPGIPFSRAARGLGMMLEMVEMRACLQPSQRQDTVRELFTWLQSVYAGEDYVTLLDLYEAVAGHEYFQERASDWTCAAGKDFFSEPPPAPPEQADAGDDLLPF